MLTIYHNPRCSKSRAALALLEQYAATGEAALRVVDYQKTPLGREELLALRALLGCPLRAMVRENEDAFAALGLENADDAALLDALVAEPRLLQRPIVVLGDRALIARPPELLQDALGHAGS